MAPTIEKVVAKLKTSQENLIQMLIKDFKNHGVKDEQALAPLEQQLKVAVHTMASGSTTRRTSSLRRRKCLRHGKRSSDG